MPSVPDRLAKLTTDIQEMTDKTAKRDPAKDKRALKKMVQDLQKPFDALVEMAKAAENGEYGPKSKEVIDFLEDAIDYVGRAQTRANHAARRL